MSVRTWFLNSVPLSARRTRGVVYGQIKCESKNNKPTVGVDTNKDVARALGAAWKLQEVKTNNVRYSRMRVVVVVPFVWAQERQHETCFSMSMHIGQ